MILLFLGRDFMKYDMNFKAAIRRLGLNVDFTERELRKAYKPLLSKYNPIGLEGVDRKYVKAIYEEICDTVDFLRKYIQLESVSENVYCAKLLKYFGQRGVEDYLDPYQVKVMNVILDFSTQSKDKQKEEVDRLFDEAKQKIKAIFDELCDKYCEDWYVDLIDKGKLDYEVSLQDFFEQFKKTREYISQFIKDEILKYQHYDEYQYLKYYIDHELEHDYKYQIKTSGLTKAIEIIRQKVEKRFAWCKRLADKFGTVKKMLDDNAASLNKEFLVGIIEEIAAVLADFKNIGDCYIEEKLTKIEEKINKIQEKIKKQIKLENYFNEYEREYEQLFKNIMAKYLESVRNYQIINDISQIYAITKTFEMANKLFALARAGKIESDSLMLLDSLTFTDEQKDAAILFSVTNNLALVNNNRIYLRKNGDVKKAIWYVLVQKEGSLYLLYCDSSSDKCVKELRVTEKEMANYISLDQFINEMKPVGEIIGFKWRKQNVLYSNGVYNVILNGNELIIDYETEFFPSICEFEIPLEYQDREYVKMKIMEKIQEYLNRGETRTRKPSQY